MKGGVQSDVGMLRSVVLKHARDAFVDQAFIGHAGEVIAVAARQVDVVDTTGAGDSFAAGFLHGLAVGLPMAQCGELATLLASDTITHLGVKLSDRAHREAVELAGSR